MGLLSALKKLGKNKDPEDTDELKKKILHLAGELGQRHHDLVAAQAEIDRLRKKNREYEDTYAEIERLRGAIDSAAHQCEEDSPAYRTLMGALLAPHPETGITPDDAVALPWRRRDPMGDLIEIDVHGGEDGDLLGEATPVASISCSSGVYLDDEGSRAAILALQECRRRKGLHPVLVSGSEQELMLRIDDLEKQRARICHQSNEQIKQLEAECKSLTQVVEGWQSFYHATKQGSLVVQHGKDVIDELISAYKSGDTRGVHLAVRHLVEDYEAGQLKLSGDLELLFKAACSNWANCEVSLVHFDGLYIADVNDGERCLGHTQGSEATEALHKLLSIAKHRRD